MSEEIKVSICMLTYNHEFYIRQAVEGILLQKRDFLIEIIIGEDFSTDQTREICFSYQHIYPEIIRVLPRERNLGMIPNFIETLKNCKGKYIALCEGDDYWTDPLKLQKQIDFLEEHPDFSLSIHNVKKLDFDGNFKDFNPNFDSNLIINFNDFLKFHIGIPTCSYLFVNNFRMPHWFENCKIGDMPLLLILFNKGRCYYFNEFMGVYRKHDGGVSKSINATNYHLIHTEVFENFKKFEKTDYEKELDQALGNLYLKAFIFERVRGHSIVKYLIKYLRLSSLRVILEKRNSVLFWILPDFIRCLIKNR